VKCPSLLGSDDFHRPPTKGNYNRIVFEGTHGPIQNGAKARQAGGGGTGEERNDEVDQASQTSAAVLGRFANPRSLACIFSVPRHKRLYLCNQSL
jgi:hypothetical protein